MKLSVSPKVEGRGLRMRSQPGFNSNIVTVLQAGELLETLDTDLIVQARLGVKDHWLHVRNSDGQTGYCAAWLLMDHEIPPAASQKSPRSDARLHQPPGFKEQPKQFDSQHQSSLFVKKNYSELTPGSTSQPQPSPTLLSSSELTPLPAVQLIPEPPGSFDPPPTNIFHDVPILAQDDLYGNAACSPVSACMLLEYYHQKNPLNRTVTPQQLIAMLDPGDGIHGKGMSLSNVTDELLSLGYQHISEKIHATLVDLKTEIIKGPLIVTVGVTLANQKPRRIQGPGNTIHAIVVKGFSPDLIIVNDPWTGKELRLQHATFEIMWKLGLNGMYMIRP